MLWIQSKKKNRYRGRCHNRRQVLETVAALPWERQTIAPEAPSIPVAWSSDTNRRPARDAAMSADVLVPLTQAAVSGGVFFIVGLGVGYVGGFPIIKAAAVVGCLGFSITWLWLLTESRSLLWEVSTQEREVPQIGAGSLEPEIAKTIRAEVQDGGKLRFGNLPGDSAALKRFAAGILGGRWTFSEQGAVDSGYGRYEFAPRKAGVSGLRDEFLKNGWAVWVSEHHHAQGVKLTPSGEALVKSLAEGDMV